MAEDNETRDNQPRDDVDPNDVESNDEPQEMQRTPYDQQALEEEQYETIERLAEESDRVQRIISPPAENAGKPANVEEPSGGVRRVTGGNTGTTGGGTTGGGRRGGGGNTRRVTPPTTNP